MSGTISQNPNRQSGAVGSIPSATKDSSDPALDTNPSGGVGTEWINTTSGQIFLCTDDTTDNNKWIGQDGGYIAPSRGVAGGGGHINSMQYIEIDTLGNAIDFGDLTQSRDPGATDNGTTGRGIFIGGDRPDPSPGADLYSNVIDYITIDTAGNATDFGDLSANVASVAGGSNGPGDRGLRVGGYKADAPAGNQNVIEYVTISTTGNMTDFGDLTTARYNMLGTSSNGTNDRCVIWGGIGAQVTIDYVTVSTTGNATDFGDEIWATYLAPTGYGWNGAGCTSNGKSERGVHVGGNSGANTAIIQYLTINSTGNSAAIGNLTAVSGPGATSNGTGDRGVFFGISSSKDTIDYMTISSTADAVDFGDMLYDQAAQACSNGMT